MWFDLDYFMLENINQTSSWKHPHHTLTHNWQFRQEALKKKIIAHVLMCCVERFFFLKKNSKPLLKAALKCSLPFWYGKAALHWKATVKCKDINISKHSGDIINHESESSVFSDVTRNLGRIYSHVHTWVFYHIKYIDPNINKNDKSYKNAKQGSSLLSLSSSYFSFSCILPLFCSSLFSLFLLVNLLVLCFLIYV